MKLRFIGANGSMGLKHGKVYDVKIESSTKNFIWVYWNDFIIHRGCPYASLKKLTENWEDVSGADMREV